MMKKKKKLNMEEEGKRKNRHRERKDDSKRVKLGEKKKWVNLEIPLLEKVKRREPKSDDFKINKVECRVIFKEGGGEDRGLRVESFGTGSVRKVYKNCTRF